MKYWLLLSLHAICWGQSNWYLRTVAGSNTIGDGGRASAASIRFLQGVASDASGNIYVSDADDHRIRRIDPAGIVTTVAGVGVAGFSGDGGPADRAQIHTPYGLTVTPLGDILFADLGNRRVRRIHRNGQIDTIAGGGSRELPASGQFIPPLEVRLGAPRNVLADRTGSIFISDFQLNRILEIRSDGSMTTLPQSIVDLNAPAGMVMDRDGELLVADSGNSRIRRMRRDGRIDVVLASSARVPLERPIGLARMADGSILIADTRGDYLWRMDALGGMTQIPMGGRDVAVDWAGNILTAGGGLLRRMNPQGLISILMTGANSQFRGDGESALSSRLNRPQASVVDSKGNLYISDTFNHRVRCVFADGRIDTVAGAGDPGFRGDGAQARDALLNTPTWLAVDAFDNIYVADTGNFRIRVFQSGGIIQTLAGTGRRERSSEGVPATETNINGVGGLAVSLQGVVYFGETGFPRIRAIGNNGIVTTVVGSSIPGRTLDGQNPLTANLTPPEVLSLDLNGNLYFADSSEGRIFVLERTATRLQQLATGFASISGLAVTPGGIIYVSESTRHAIRQITPSGQTSVIAGRIGISGFNVDAGDAATVVLSGPRGLSLAPDGALVFADEFNARVRRIEPPVEVKVSNLQAFRVVHGATFLEGPVAPGLLLSLLSSGLPNPQLLEVTFDRVAAPLLFANGNQLNFQVPETVAGRESVVLELRSGGELLFRTTLAVQGAAPGFFEQGGLVVGPTQAVRGGDVVTLYATGEGLTRMVDGRKIPFLPLSVEVAGIPAEVLTAENSGLLQLTIRIPQGINLRGHVPVSLRVGPFENPRTQRIAVE